MSPNEQHVPQTRHRGAVAEIFGQFATKQFWKELVRVLAQEAIATFLMALGGTLVWYGKSKRNQEVSTETNSVSSIASRAFSNNSFTPGPSYQPTPPPPSSQSGQFPGF